MMSHTHQRTDELHVFSVPADTDQKCELKVVANNYQALTELVGGYMEIVRSIAIPKLQCGCLMVMVVNEEGLLRNLPTNTRAGLYYPGRIVGDVFFVGEGPVQSPGESFPEPDFFSLPPYMNTWEGPGAPLPTSQKQPWED